VSKVGLGNCFIEATIAVSDLAIAKQFYEGRLGLTGEDEENAVRYTCGAGSRLFIYHSPENAGSGRGTSAGWFVDDLDATTNELAARGVTFEHYDQPGITTDDRGIWEGDRQRAAWVKDPDGNTLAITQLRRAGSTPTLHS
jgi:catechol 2,3-dioxygenase-like lactoylglutathione lyase family enzyme